MTTVFIGITLIAALSATFVRQMRKAILSLWVVNLGIGGLYLIVGAEFLAIVQWIMSTLTTLSFIFFSVMYGEFSSEPTPQTTQELLRSGLAVVLGLLFPLIIWLGISDASPVAGVSHVVSDLASQATRLTQDHLLSLEVLALTLFLVLVGGGVVARSEGDEP